MRRILIVEDDLDILEMLCAWLGEAGYAVVTAEDGLQALDAFAASPLIWCCST